MWPRTGRRRRWGGVAVGLLLAIAFYYVVDIGGDSRFQSSSSSSKVLSPPSSSYCAPLLPESVFANPDCEEINNASSIFPPINPTKHIPSSSSLQSVHYLGEDSDGDLVTCTMLEILAGAVHNVMLSPRSPATSALALGPAFSNLVKNLDLAYLTQDFPLLLDCSVCHPSGGVIDSRTVRCRTVFYRGKEEKESNNNVDYYPVHKYHTASGMSSRWFGASELRFSTVLARYVVPALAIRTSIERIVMTNKARRGVLLGVHRTNLDGMCYKFLGQERMYECALNPQLGQQVKAMRNTGLLHKQAEHPLLMTCNYSLDAAQVSILQREWPTVFDYAGKMFDVLLTTDSRSGSNDDGDERLLLSSQAVRSSFTLSSSNKDGTCTSERHPQRPHRLRFKEMYALALTDYHMANPCSLCDVIVVHWRRMLGKPTGSSFPTMYYDGHYESDKLDAWEDDMPFYYRDTSSSSNEAADEAELWPQSRKKRKRTTCPKVRQVDENPPCEKIATNGTASLFPLPPPASSSLPPAASSFTSVHVLEDSDWGFTCNKMEILAAAMHNVYMKPRGESSALALGPVFSNLAKNLDLSHLAAHFPILLDCRICDKIARVRCDSVVMQGSVVNSSTISPIYTLYKATDMYLKFGPSELGFVVPLAMLVVPSREIRLAVEQMIAGRQRQRRQHQVLGVHRRDIDGFCYEFIGGGPGEYECWTGGKGNGDGDIRPQVRAVQYVGAKHLRDTGDFAKLKELEGQHPLLMTCNYSLDAVQVGILQREWPGVFTSSSSSSSLDMLMTTDSNDIPGDNKLTESNAISSWFVLGNSRRDSEDDDDDDDDHHNAVCTNERHPQRPHRLMLKEMYALALADYHMANPCSSCDVIVVHWRRMMSKPAGSSFPPKCYDGHYRYGGGGGVDALVAQWQASMPFFAAE